jgi:hypothetical protein
MSKHTQLAKKALDREGYAAAYQVQMDRLDRGKATWREVKEFLQRPLCVT